MQNDGDSVEGWKEGMEEKFICGPLPVSGFLLVKFTLPGIDFPYFWVLLLGLCG